MESIAWKSDIERCISVLSVEVNRMDLRNSTLVHVAGKVPTSFKELFINPIKTLVICIGFLFCKAFNMKFRFEALGKLYEAG